MNWEEMVKAAEWVAMRWPESPWSNEDVNLIKSDMAEIKGEKRDLAAVLTEAYNRGDDFPPPPRQIKAGVIAALRRRAADRPVLEEEPAVDPRDWVRRRGFSSLAEAAGITQDQGGDARSSPIEGAEDGAEEEREPT